MSNTQDTCSVSLLFALIVIPSSIVPVTLFSPYTVFNTSTFSTSKSFNLNVSALLACMFSTVSPPHAFCSSVSGLFVFVIPSSEQYPSPLKAALSCVVTSFGSSVPIGATKTAPPILGFPALTLFTSDIFLSPFSSTLC